MVTFNTAVAPSVGKHTHIHTQRPNMEKKTTHTSSYDGELAFLGCDCAWLCINSSMLWHAPCEELCTPTGRCAGVADTGIIREQETKRQHYRDRDTCGALIKGGLLTNDCCTILCRYSAPLCSFPEKIKNRKDSWDAAAAALHPFKGLCGTSTIPFLWGEVRFWERILVLLFSSSRHSHMPRRAYLCERPPPVAVILSVTHSGSFWLSAAEDAEHAKVNEGKVLIFFGSGSHSRATGRSAAKLRWTTD